MKTNFAIQLYSLRDEVKDDFFGLLKKVKDIGYDGVEFAGFHGVKANELKRVLDVLGLKSEGSHTSYNDLRDNLPQMIEYNKILGTKYMILPCVGAKKGEEFLKLADFCEKTGKIIRENGMKFLYHNHDFEFIPFSDGQTGYDILTENTSSENMGFQLDLYWVKHIGLDPLSYMKKMGGRCETVHIKDMKDSPDKATTEVGTGIIDFKEILEYGIKNNFEWFTLEQDDIFMDRFLSIEISLNNVKKIVAGI